MRGTIGSRFFAGCAALALCVGCGAVPVQSWGAGAALRGRVLEASSDRPLPGVWLVGHYTAEGGAFAAHSETACYRFEAVQSDANAEYAFEADRRGTPLVVSVYLREYTGTRNPLFVQKRVSQDGKATVTWWVIERSTSRPVRPEPYASEDEARAAAHSTDLYLAPYAGTRERRLDDLFATVTASVCAQADRRRQGQVAFLEAIRAEMTALAVTDKERSLVERVDNMIRSARRVAEGG